MNRPIQTGPIAEGRTAIKDGEQYYIIGKTRIKITEHFRPDGKPIEDLVAALIENKIKENTGKGT